ncbi:uncharacterized protein LOC122922566 [Bufo gargarizans]|uniref:uncharacterized protein LOC122922566 n=1 Tax=Bufo gargarizans TaxID=30331 RepID=UPI001CF121E6|nr:uncharacterized protein LOC122922566 [Bufo gargarizans]
MAFHPPHSADKEQIMDPLQQNLFFEGFLRKRKDTMKLTWAKYWFKLQNTTLYFYTKRNAEPACLRGQYHMYSAQSVRRVDTPDGDFTFEIVMKNGKKKLLSAESDELRDVWIQLLWKSMQLPGPSRSSSSCTWFDVPELVRRGHSASLPFSSDQTLSDGVSENPPGSVQQSESSSSLDNSSFPTSTRSVQDVHSGSDGSANPDSNIYDFPRPHIYPSTQPAAAPDAASPASLVPSWGDGTKSLFPGVEPQRMLMTDINVYDTPVPMTSQRLAGLDTAGTSDA